MSIKTEYFISFRFCHFLYVIDYIFAKMNQKPEEMESLLDVTMKKYPKDQIKKIFNLRIFMVTKIPEEANKDQIKEYLHQWTNRDDNEPIVGVTLLCPGTTMHLIQSGCEKMFEFLRALNTEKEKHGMWPIKILLSTDNVPVDTIKFYEIISIDSLKQDNFSANVPIEISISEVYNALLSLAELLSQLTDLKRGDAISNIVKEYGQYLPADYRVLNFADNPELVLIEEYLDIYDTPIRWTPLIETLWPPQRDYDLPTIEAISTMDRTEQTETK